MKSRRRYSKAIMSNEWHWVWNIWTIFENWIWYDCRYSLDTVNWLIICTCSKVFKPCMRSHSHWTEWVKKVLHGMKHANEIHGCGTTQLSTHSVNTSFVTGWPLHIALITLKGTSEGWWRKKPWLEEDSNFIDICHTNLIQVLYLHGIIFDSVIHIMF